MKDMRDKKAKGDENVPGDVIKILAEDGLKLTTQLVKNVCKTGECPSDCLEEEPRSYNMQLPSHNQPHRSYSKDSSECT
jgi:hypothetical protein